MSYDWEKIFTDKSKDELFEIYSGNSFLPNETIIYAKQELERNVSAERLDTINNQINRNIVDDNKIKVLLSYISIGFALLFLIIKIILFFIEK